MGNDYNDDFIERCRKIDFSIESFNKERNFDALKKKVIEFQNEGDVNMKRLRKPLAVALVAAAVLVCLTVTVYGKSIATAIKSIFIGNYVQYDYVADRQQALPEELEEKPVNGEINSEPAWQQLEFYDLKEGLSYFTDEILMPEYLPEGYSFEKISFSDNCLNENGKTKIMDIFYSNGDNGSILCMIRFMDEETAFTGRRGYEPEEISINGHRAAIIGFSLHIQIRDVLYEFFPGSADIGVDELIKIAETL